MCRSASSETSGIPFFELLLVRLRTESLLCHAILTLCHMTAPAAQGTSARRNVSAGSSELNDLIQSMKPITEFIQRIDRRTLSQGNRAGRRRLPLTDYCFQSGGIDKSATGNRQQSECSFRKLSQQYSSREAMGVFLSEALLFCLITAIAAFSLIDCAGALARFLQSSSPL